MNTNSSSITFYCPNHIKHSFDELVKFKRSNRTSIINNLMENYLRTEHHKIKEDQTLQNLLDDVKVRTHQNITKRSSKKSTTPIRSTQWLSERINVDDDEPMIPHSTDNQQNHIDDWDDISGINHLWKLK